MLLNPYLYHQALSINTNTNTKNDFKYLIPKNTIQTLSINRFTPIHDIQEEKKDIPEIKNISLKKIDDSNEINPFDQELNEIKKEFFSELPDEEKDDILDFENQFIKPSDQDQIIKPSDQDQIIKPLDQDQIIEPSDQDQIIEPSDQDQGPIIEQIESSDQDQGPIIEQIESSDQVSFDGRTHTNIQTGGQVLLDNISSSSSHKGGTDVKNVMVSFF